MSSIKSILRESISQMGLVENISLPYIALVLGTALGCALIIYFVYKYFYRGAVYSENFGLLIIMSTMTVAFIIMTISSNIVLSLGMVGALSIVRFRTAVKDPLDVGFLFLAIGAGLTAGAGLFFIAIIGTVIICMTFAVFFFVGKARVSYLLIIRCDMKAEEKIKELLKNTRKTLKSKSCDGNIEELTYTIRVKDDSVVADILKIEGVQSALLVAYTGDAQY